MSLKEQLAQDLKLSMKEKDTVKKNAVQSIRAAIKQVEIDTRAELDEAGVIDVVAKELKRRKDVLPEYEKSGRDDLIVSLKAEIEYLSKYLPEQMSEDEIREVVKAVVAETGAQGMKDMGKVMGAVIAKTKGRADGKVINVIVKECLNA